MQATLLVKGRSQRTLFDRARELPGAFFYVGAGPHFPDVGITHSCPCGCSRLSFCHLLPGPGHPVWTISGPRAAPTLAPSVGIHYLPGEPHDRGAYHWHGYLRSGAWHEE